MSALLNYIIQVIAISGILYGYYHFALRNKRFHQYNRFYLLISAGLSLAIPFLNIPVYFAAAEQQPFFIQQTLAVISSNDTEELVTNAASVTGTTWFSLQNILLSLYLLIALLVFTRMVLSVIRIKQLIKAHSVEKLENINFVNTSAPNTPFSFFNWMFWNNKIELQSEKGKQIFRHEFFHIKQRHSWDVVFMELITILFWINPFFHLIKREAKTIHEFLADQFAMKDTQHWQYAELLLMQALNTNQHLVNPFFHNQIKRRIAMITTSKKPSYQYIRKMMLLPLAGIIVMLFAFNYKSTTSEPPLDKFFTVIIDAGHGGDDKGASATDGTLEKDIVLAIAQKVKALNDDKNLRIIFTREDDIYPTLEERVGNTSKHNADMFLSLHISSTPKTPTTKSGFEIYISEKNKKFEVENRRLANIMLNNFDPLYTINRNILTRRMAVFVLDNAPCPSVLIECGYINNPKDLDFIKDPSRQDDIAKSILKSIKHFALADKITATPENEIVIYTSTPKGKAIPQIDKIEIKLNGQKKLSKIASGTLIILDDLKLSPSEGEVILKQLDPIKISTVTILKGQSAISKYGEMGLNGVIEITTKEKANIADTTVKPKTDNIIFDKVEIEAAFPGGSEKWKKYLQTNLKGNTPLLKGAPDRNYTVIVQFIVRKDGTISDIIALSKHGYGMEEEAVRVIKIGPKWLPAIQNGKEVTAIRHQPITFVVERETTSTAKTSM